MPLVKMCMDPRCANTHTNEGSRCDLHKKDKPRFRRFKGEGPDRFYDSPEWRELRAVKLSDDPLCEVCQERPSTEVHHKIPKRERPDLALEYSNLQSICKQCHYKQTSREALAVKANQLILKRK